MNLFTLGKSYLDNNPNSQNDNPVVSFRLNFKLRYIIEFILKFAILTLTITFIIYIIASLNSITAFKNLKFIFTQFYTLCPPILLCLLVLRFLPHKLILNSIDGTEFVFSNKFSLFINKVNYAPYLFIIEKEYLYIFANQFNISFTDAAGTELTKSKENISIGNYISFSIFNKRECLDSINYSFKIDKKNIYMVREAYENFDK